MENSNKEKSNDAQGQASNKDIEIQIYSLQLARGKLNQIIDETNSNRKISKMDLRRVHQLNKSLIDIFEEF